MYEIIPPVTVIVFIETGLGSTVLHYLPLLQINVNMAFCSASRMRCLSYGTLPSHGFTFQSNKRKIKASIFILIDVLQAIDELNVSQVHRISVKSM